MTSITSILFGLNESADITKLFYKIRDSKKSVKISEEEAKKVSEAFVEAHAREIVNKLNSECPRKLEFIYYETNSPEKLFTDYFICEGYTDMVGEIIAKAHPGYKLIGVTGSGMTFKKE